MRKTGRLSLKSANWNHTEFAGYPAAYPSLKLKGGVHLPHRQFLRYLIHGYLMEQLGLPYLARPDFHHRFVTAEADFEVETWMRKGHQLCEMTARRQKKEEGS